MVVAPWHARVCTLFLFLSLLAVAPGTTAQESAEGTTLWFVGEGSDEIITSPLGDGIYEMSPEGHGGQTSSFITVAGNNVDNNPFLPTFTLDAPVTFSGGPVTAYHYAAQLGAAAGCGLIGYLYSGADVLANTEVVPAVSGVSYDEFVFVFEDLEGTYPSLSFQAVQSSNQCGWATIEHVWGSDDYPGRLILPAAAPAAPLVQSLFENLTTPSFLHEFVNATSDDYTLNVTVPWANVTIDRIFEVQNGSANVTVLRDGETILEFRVDNQTAPVAPAASTDDNATAPPPEVFEAVAGNWSIIIDYEGFVGSLGLTVNKFAPAPPPVTTDTNTTNEPETDADVVDENAPGPALPLLALALVVVVAVVRRRRD